MALRAGLKACATRRRTQRPQRAQSVKPEGPCGLGGLRVQCHAALQGCEMYVGHRRPLVSAGLYRPAKMAAECTEVRLQPDPSVSLVREKHGRPRQDGDGDVD